MTKGYSTMPIPIDFNHSKVTLDDGLEVLVIDMDWVPDAGWDSE